MLSPDHQARLERKIKIIQCPYSIKSPLNSQKQTNTHPQFNPFSTYH